MSIAEGYKAVKQALFGLDGPCLSLAETKDYLNKTCPCCNLKVVTDKQVKVWSEIGGQLYHNRCLSVAVAESKQLEKIQEVLNAGRLTGLRHVSICDVWICDQCGGYSYGYDPGHCRHCGAKAHYGSNNGCYSRSDQIE